MSIHIYDPNDSNGNQHRYYDQASDIPNPQLEQLSCLEEIYLSEITHLQASTQDTLQPNKNCLTDIFLEQIQDLISQAILEVTRGIPEDYDSEKIDKAIWENKAIAYEKFFALRDTLASDFAQRYAVLKDLARPDTQISNTFFNASPRVFDEQIENRFSQFLSNLEKRSGPLELVI